MIRAWPLAALCAGITTCGLAAPQDRLARTAQALQSIKAMQDAARAAATASSVPNGLIAGGLQVNNAAPWTGAGAPQQTVANGQTKVTIAQNAPQAMLNWTTFNVGKETTLTFDQSLGGADKRKWVAFNKVNDPAGVPSQILGQIQAPGQVYVINANGIIFGGSAQINVNSLIASALPINDNLIARGLLNNPDTQFLFSALPLAAGANGTPAFTPATPATPDGLPGDVTVQAGAKITTPTTADKLGGRVVLVGANVQNNGQISTPDGQTILAAGLQVGFAAHSATDPALRGLDVYVGAISDPAHPGTAGNARNTGLINVPRGNATMAGAAVDQLGFIDSTTSVSLNGRIDLLADYNAVGSGGFAGQPAFFARNTGIVTLGPDSVTRILPEVNSADKVVGTALALQSQINIEGLGIDLGENALVLAPSAKALLRAGIWRVERLGTSAALQTFVSGNGFGQVYFDSGAAIDVAGTVGAAVSVADNVVAVQLGGTELADAPLLRNGLLRGKTIYVDARDTGTYNGKSWVGTPLADASGYVNLIQRSVAELTTAGGNVTIKAGESVVMQPGSAIDVSGGWVNYQGANKQVTRLVSAGKSILASQATPDRIYDYAITTTEYEAGYVQGKDGGSLSITAPSMALDGKLVGRTVTGPRQQFQAPKPGSLTLAFQAQDLNNTLYVPYSPTPPAIRFDTTSALAPADPFALDGAGKPVALRSDRKSQVVLAPDLIGANGFGSFTLDNSDGSVTLPAGVELRNLPGGTITFAAGNINLQGKIIAPGGNLQFTVYDYTPFAQALQFTPAPDATRGQFTLGAAGELNVAGTTDFAYSDDPNPRQINGGSISIRSYNADLAAGSVLDASGGLRTSGTGARTYGNGGTISIAAGQDPKLTAIRGGHLTLGAELRGFSGAKGGSLSILAPLVQIGGTTTDPNTLLFAPEFFSAGGFNSFTLRGLGAPGAQPYAFVPGLLIVPGTVIAPRVESRIAEPGADSLSSFIQPDGVRSPVNLSFGAVGIRDGFAADPLVARGDVVVGEGAVIRTEPRGSVTLGGETVAVLGSIIAPGGTIGLSGAANSIGLFTELQRALPTVHVGPHAQLLAQGTTVLTPNAFGYRTGSVLAGGRITLAGNIVAESGAVLDVSGTSDTLDVSPGYLGKGLNVGPVMLGTSFVPTRIDSEGGSIAFTGGQQLISAATLKAFGGGTTASGGSLTISSGRFYSLQTANSAKTPLDVTLSVAQQSIGLSSSFYSGDATAIGHVVLNSQNQPLAGQGYFAADSFAAGGFASLTLRGTVQFNGPVSITANRQIALADRGVLFADNTVQLAAPYIAVGLPFQAPQSITQIRTPYQDGDGRPFNFTPSYGAGNLTLTASSLLDIGPLSLQQIGQATFAAVGGDIRGNGNLDIAGNLTLRAGQVYPPTASSFTIAAYNYSLNGVTQPGSVTIESTGLRQLPLSAGGTLSIYAAQIFQNGTLRAPLGTIRLGWDGSGAAPVDVTTGSAVVPTTQLVLGDHSVTSVSAIDPLTGKALTLPYGLDLNGTAWIDPTGVDITRGGLAQKAINLAGASIAINDGAELDIRGGGDAFAYRWVRGPGGSQDILGSAGSFAIVPGYQANYAPYAPFNPSPVDAGVFGSDPGYVNANLRVGDQVYLQASPGLPAGMYTLLPARYALLPGAFLVTPLAGVPVGATTPIPGGSSLVSGYRQNSLDVAHTGNPLAARFQVSPASVVKAAAEYDTYSANLTLAATGRLPVDAGQLVFSATQALALNGTVKAQAGSGGLGGLVDISSPQNIVIAGPTTPAVPGALMLPALELSSFNAASLLIGGIRQTDSTGTKVTVQTGNLTVDNAGAALTGPDIILVAKLQLALAPGAAVTVPVGATGKADPITVGDASTAGSGNGALLRVSADPSGTVTRRGVNTATQPALSIGAGAQVTGASVILDSTRNTTLDPTATVRGSYVSIASGRISLALTDPGALQAGAGLVLTGDALANLQSGAQSLALVSYSSIDTYGTGQVGQNTLANFALRAAEIRGFNQADGTVQFVSKNISLDNSPNGTVPGAVGLPGGTLAFEAGVITLGSNQTRIDQFANVAFTAAKGIQLQGTGGLTTPGDLTLTAPVVVGLTGADQTLVAGGAVVLNPVSTTPTMAAGLGARLAVVGASVTDNTRIQLPSGIARLEATAGDVTLGGSAVLDAGGVSKNFYDQTRYTDGGQVTLRAAQGSVELAAGSVVNVSAQSQAGSVALLAPAGSVTLSGSITGSGGQGGSFQLDVGSLPDPSLAAWNAALNANGFALARSFRVRSGDVTVDGLAQARAFELTADNGSIDVTGTIDASGVTGGKIELAAAGRVTLLDGSRLTVAGQKANSAGKGGSVLLDGGLVDVQGGATIELAGGTLHLRAPQTADNLDVQIEPINGAVLHASRIVVEGVQQFDASQIDDAVKADVFANGTTFAGNSDAIASRLLANNAGLVLAIRPGAEIVNPSGDLTLSETWDLSTYRFGPQNQPGLLTLRAAGNINFDYNSSLGQFASLSDGFDGAAYDSQLLPAGSESWSYRLIAGGSVLLGRNAQAKGPIPNSNQSAPNIIPNYFQVIRTGTGDIDISAGRDVQFLSPLAAIYTAGTQADALPDFDLPDLNYPTGTVLGGLQYDSPYPAQYSYRGGDVSIAAQRDIVRYQVSSTGVLTLDSSREMPSNWLYRRGAIDPATGEFGVTRNYNADGDPIAEVASTTWWIDFSRFFQGVGTLGGGQIALSAGRDVSNVDAVAPTNGRMAKGTPRQESLVELGGGDVSVTAGRDINGGTYYVERGEGTLRAGDSVRTNPGRAALDKTTVDALRIQNAVPDATTWLPTTLFLGKGTFDVAARGDVLLGPVANPFLLPQGINNSFYQKSYFSTYSLAAGVDVSSLAGSVTLKDNANPTSDGVAGSLAAWYQNVLLFTQNANSFATKSQPWLRLAETRVALEQFATAFSLMPPTLRATAYSGDLNVVGTLTLSPSPTGQLELLAAKSLNGFQPNGLNSVRRTYQWGSSRINLSDADPSRLPGILAPLSLAYLGPDATDSQERSAWSNPQQRVINGVFQNINSLFAESGSSQGNYGVLQTKLALHAAGPLHAGDTEPVRLYAQGGDISGVTLFAGKETRVVASQDITDIALYLQNVAADDISVVSAGRDIIAYNPNSQLRLSAQQGNNELLLTQPGRPSAGDIQISGPGTLEVLAGRNLDLGVGPNANDGTAVGITSIGNARNPGLPFGGADIVAAAGIGSSAGLDQSGLNFSGFIAKFIDPGTAGDNATRYLPELGVLLGLPKGASSTLIWNAFQNLPQEQRSRYLVDLFCRVLRDAGRDHNNPKSPGYGNYDAGFAAIAALFPASTTWRGDVTLTSREIKTASGGDITLVAPGGQLLVGFDLSGNQPVDQGVLTEAGGNISIFTRQSAIVGTSRIFTLRGGNIIMWSSEGDIAAGASSKTVQSAPPTRVLIDPQTADVKTDLAGLATGGGIGVLTTVAGVPPGDVDLIAPAGSIDAGDAGIRVSGNINLAALQVLNVANIQVQGVSAGVPQFNVSLNVAGLQAANNTVAATAAGASGAAGSGQNAATAQEDVPSLVSVEVLGYGGGDGEDQKQRDDDDHKGADSGARDPANG